MAETIIFGLLVLVVLGFAGFLFWQSQKQMQTFMQQMTKNTEMMMAGSFQEWDRLKKGKKALPNKVVEEKNFEELSEDKRIPWEEITGVQVDEGPKRIVKLYH